MDDARKQAEITYPVAIGDEGRAWLRNKPFGNTPRETARHVIDFGYALQLLDLRPGMLLCELGCGSGWMTRFFSRHGVHATGFDIAPEMIAIAREQAAAEGLGAQFVVADMENLEVDERFDACLIYDALHHSAQPQRVLASARRVLKPGGRLLIAEPNWKHRFQGRRASGEWGTTELGYSPRQLKKILRGLGFEEIERFHNNRKRLFSNGALDLAAHLAEPIVYRALAPFWTQIWLRATAR